MTKQPAAVSHAKHPVGLRTVALLEAAKGVFVLLAGFGVLALINKDLDDMAARLTEILHVNPEGKLSHLFFHLADRATDKTLWVVAIGALVYAVVRLVEAFGLWRGREWAQWFALLSGALFLPEEVYSLLRHPRALKWAVLALNVAIVLYMLFLRVKERRSEGAAGQ